MDHRHYYAPLTVFYRYFRLVGIGAEIPDERDDVNRCMYAVELELYGDAHEDFRDQTDTSKIGESYSLLMVVDYDAYMLGQGNDKQ